MKCAFCEIRILLKKCSETGTEGCVISPVTGEARCNCLDGFEGETCELRWEAKFKNAYSAEESCGFGIGTYPMSVEIGPDPGQVTFINFNNKQPNNIPAKVVANLLTSRVFQIYTQYMAFGAVSGQGSYRTDGGIEFSYQIISNGDTLLCESLLRPN